jgi:hypothetical protein
MRLWVQSPGPKPEENTQPPPHPPPKKKKIERDVSARERVSSALRG